MTNQSELIVKFFDPDMEYDESKEPKPKESECNHKHSDGCCDNGCGTRWCDTCSVELYWKLGQLYIGHDPRCGLYVKGEYFRPSKQDRIKPEPLDEKKEKELEIRKQKSLKQ